MRLQKAPDLIYNTDELRKIRLKGLYKPPLPELVVMKLHHFYLKQSNYLTRPTYILKK